MLLRLRKVKLYYDIDKSNFYIYKIKYLGIIITIYGLKMNSNKIKTIRE